MLHIKFCWQFFLSALSRSHFIAFWLLLFLDKKSVIISFLFPGIESASFYMKVTVFMIFSLSLVFSSLAVCIGVIFLYLFYVDSLKFLYQYVNVFLGCMWSWGPLFLQIFIPILIVSLFLGLNYFFLGCLILSHGLLSLFLFFQ